MQEILLAMQKILLAMQDSFLAMQGRISPCRDFFAFPRGDYVTFGLLVANAHSPSRAESHRTGMWS